MSRRRPADEDPVVELADEDEELTPSFERPEVPPADALDQARVVMFDEDDDGHDRSGDQADDPVDRYAP
jgi:hypothetical protein